MTEDGGSSPEWGTGDVQLPHVGRQREEGVGPAKTSRSVKSTSRESKKRKKTFDELEEELRAGDFKDADNAIKDRPILREIFDSQEILVSKKRKLQLLLAYVDNRIQENCWHEAEEESDMVATFMPGVVQCTIQLALEFAQNLTDQLTS